MTPAEPAPGPASGRPSGPPSRPPSRSPSGAADESLLRRLREGDEAAFAELVRLHGGRMRAAARRILGDDHEADDALQEAFLSAFESLDRFEGRAALGTWLHRIAVNAALVRLRARRRRGEESIDELLPRWKEDGHHAASWAQWSGTDDDPLVRAEVRALVRASIDRLPDGHRAVLVLRDLEGWSTAETAAALSIGQDAAKVRLHRARQALRGLLDPHLRGAPS